MATICYKCKHHKQEDPGSATDLNGNPLPSDMWYFQYCTAHPRPKVTDPVTGEVGYSLSNDLGRALVTKEQYPYCQDINKGNCPDYQSEDKPIPGCFREAFK